MSPDEAVRLMAVARAAFPGMSIVEGQGRIWHEALGDLTFDECVRAIVEHAKVSSRIVDLAEIRSQVSGARRAVAGEERQHELEIRRGTRSDRLVPMPSWFRQMYEQSLAETRASGKYGKGPGPMAKDIDDIAGGAA